MSKKRLKKKVGQLLNKARESSILAVSTYNTPGTVFKSSAYIVLMNIAWTSLFHSIFERDGVRYYYRDPQDKRRYMRIDGELKSWELSKCAKEYFKNPNDPMYVNIRFFIKLRNKIEHSFTPEIDLYIFGECQSYLINFEEILVKEFGDKFALSDSLIFALQYSKIKTEEQVKALKRSQSKDLKLIRNYIDDFRRNLDTSILSNPSYSLKVFLIPKPANRLNTADCAIEFVKYDPEKPEEMEKYEHLVALIKEKQVPSEHSTKKLKMVTDPTETHEHVLLVKSDGMDGQTLVGITHDSEKANGVLVYPKISADVFNDATGFVDAALILNQKTGEFPFSERSTYFVYSGREKINSKEAFELFLSGSYNHRKYIPYYYWLTKLESDVILNFMYKSLEEMSYPRVLSLFRLFIATENESWLNYTLEVLKKIDHHTQKPQWDWSFKSMLEHSRQKSPLFAAIGMGNTQIIFGNKVENLIENFELANKTLSEICTEFATTGNVDHTLIRKLDLIVYYRELLTRLPNPE